LGALEAILVARECGLVLADAHLVGHLPATVALESGGVDLELRKALARGERRAALVDATGAGISGLTGADDPTLRLSGRIDHALDAPGADLIVVCDRVTGVAAWTLVPADGVDVEARPSYDATRALADVSFDDARVERLDVSASNVVRVLDLQQALLGAESLGAADACLSLAREHAISRVAFGRAIGSYQAVKHTLVEMLRRNENARALAYYAGWSWLQRPEEFGPTALALRVVADEAIYRGARESIFIHGAVGATWEHDASLYYRRAELSRRLLGGADEVACLLADILIAREREPATAAVAAVGAEATQTV
jgi:alkylation response protein AidB-like acyl-CoA dehydrogenase